MSASPIETVIKAVEGINPFDHLETEHKADALAWIASGAPIFRISKPDNPPKHLVSYFVLFDESNTSVLLIDHIKSKLWLPTGGHLKINEDPYNAVVREAREELSIVPDCGTRFGAKPFFLTVTRTIGSNQHTDVSLWYVLKGRVGAVLDYNGYEMNGYKWLTLDEVLATDISTIDEHMHRFVKKLKLQLS